MPAPGSGDAWADIVASPAASGTDSAAATPQASLRRLDIEFRAMSVPFKRVRFGVAWRESADTAYTIRTKAHRSTRGRRARARTRADAVTHLTII
ncbi:hypothetical protein GCM10027521_14010 [Amycolatopsis cihanbeyliensis]